MKSIVLISTVAAGLFLASELRAGGGLEPNRLIQPDRLNPPASGENEQTKPLESVLRAIQQRLPGRALDARLVQRGGRQAYLIKWFSDEGRVRDITADARSGEILDMR